MKFPFCSSRHGQKQKSCKHKGGGKTYDPGKEETKKARKTTTQRKHTSVGVTEDLRLNVAKYYNRLNSLLRREEAARKKLIVEEPRTQRKVSVVLVHRYLREILNVGYELI